MKYTQFYPAFLLVLLMSGCGQDSELLQLQQQLKQTQQQLKMSNAKLTAARKTVTAEKLRFDALEKEKALLEKERMAMADTAQHISYLEKQLLSQTTHLDKLQKTLLDTEAGCREVAEELALSKSSS